MKGNNGLGGIDIDNILTFDIIKKYSILKSNIKWLNKIKNCAEEIKIKLTSQTNYSVYLENVPVMKFNKLEYIDNLKITYSRQEFNNLMNEIIDEMIQSIKNMYHKYNTTNIIFIGGPTQIPLLQSKVCSILNIEPNNLSTIGTWSNSNPNPNLNQTPYDLSILYKTIVSQGGSIYIKKLWEKKIFVYLI